MMVPSRSLPPTEDAENGGDRHADPTELATDFFAALALQDWDDAVRFLEPHSLAEFRESQLAQFASWVEQRDAIRRARAERRGHSWGSDEVLRAEQLERHGNVTLNAFAGAPTLRELAELPAENFAARFLAAGRNAPSAYRVFGHVLEGDDVAHVVYRPIQAGYVGDPLRVAVLHLRRHDAEWCVLMSEQLADGAFILFHLDFPEEPGESDLEVGPG